jgi:ABC-2 type transport system permease protein
MEKIQAMLFSENGFINAVARNFPPAKWISMALINYNTLNGFLMFILFAATTVIFIAAFMFFGEKLFLGGFLGSRETEAKRKRIDEGKLESEVEVKSKVWAIFWREFRILNRVPIFFMNCVLVVILIPAIFLIMPLASGNESSRAISELINGSQSIYIATIVVVGISIFTSIANMTASTSLSREGSEFFISKYIPVSPSEQIMGKFIHAFMLDAAGNLLTAIAILYILRLNIAYIFIIFVISSLAAIPITAIALMIDMFRPYLNWDNPTKAVKQNLNGVVAMFFNALWNGILLFAAGNLIQNPAIGYVVLIVVYAALGFGLYKALLMYAEKRYAQIEA